MPRRSTSSLSTSSITLRPPRIGVSSTTCSRAFCSRSRRRPNGRTGSTSGRGPMGVPRSTCVSGTRSTVSSSLPFNTSASRTRPIFPESAGRPVSTKRLTSGASTPVTTSVRTLSYGSLPGSLRNHGVCVRSRSAQPSSTRSTWPGSSTNAASHPLRSRGKRRSSCATSKSPGCSAASSARSSPAMCSTKASTFPRSTRSSFCGRPSRSPCFSSRSDAAYVAIDNKEVCTVLDFVANYRREFRFDLRLRALTGIGRRDLVGATEAGISVPADGLSPRARTAGS